MPTSRLSSRSDVFADSKAASIATFTSSIVGTVWVIVCVAVIVAMVCQSCFQLAGMQCWEEHPTSSAGASYMSSLPDPRLAIAARDKRGEPRPTRWANPGHSGDTHDRMIRVTITNKCHLQR